MASPSSRPSGSSEPGWTEEMDDISITSTNHDDDADHEKEWVVDDVLAERDHPDGTGEKQYLIKWENFPMDQCTWEPVENLGPGLLAEWNETKKEIEAGRRQPFDVEVFNAAYRARYARHERRNTKRIHLGLPPTYLPSPNPPIPEDSASAASRDEVGFDDEIRETDDIDPDRLPPTTRPQQVIKQKSSHIVPPENPREETSGTPNVKKTKHKQPLTPVPPPKPAQRPTEPKRAASNDAMVAKTKTGYQGTARKPNTGMTSRPSSSAVPSSKGVGQKAPSSTSKTSSATPPKMTSTLANKFAGKKLTATRSRPQPAPPPPRRGNIFNSGKERKKRASLGDTMDDPSKAPKAFNSMRIVNLAKKRGIERKDIAHPDISSIPPSFIINNERNNRSSVDKTKTNVPSAPPEPPPLVQSPTAISPISTSAPALAPKAKKSVRFTGAEDIPPEDVPMVDAPSNVVDHPDSGPGGAGYSSSSSGPAKVLPQARRLSLASYQERGQTQVVLKTAVFGKAGSESARVLFTDIVRQSQPWLTAFIAQERLDFSSICASYIFMGHKVSLVEEVLSAGAIEGTSNEIRSTLTNVAEHLRRGSYACHLVTEQFSILVYPSQCSGWDGLGLEKNMSGSPLRHMIYRSPGDTRLYPPMSVPRAPARLSEIDQASHCRILVKDLFGLDFSQFLPQVPSEKDKQVFMLIFPEREAQVCNMIKLWLRSCQPNCRIFSQELKDSWAKFHETVRATGGAGTIILHEDASVSIRKLPRIFQLLDNKRCYTFWDLATGQYNPPRFPSNVSATIEPGTLQMTRLFPHGRAFLITPSFALSDPVRLCHFLEWFRGYSANPHYLIMACADFPNYLKAITLEKAKEHEEMSSSHKDDPRLEEMLADHGLGKKDLDARFRAWEILKDIMEKFRDEEASEEIRKVSWITDFIDPNDEQSLVNWFCWWSGLKCDQYRKFTVLGSSNSRIRAAYRSIEIPAYTEETVGDPDVALAREDKRRRAKEAEASDEIRRSNQDAFTTSTSANTGSTPTTPVSRQSSNFKSSLFRSDSAAELRQWIIAQFDHSRFVNWARVHVNPVSWLTVSMADHFSDPRCEYDTFKNWLGHTPEFSRSVNTWYGLFYTIDKEWNPEAPPRTYGRHPWIAVIRPADPHLHPTKYSRIELFIWDVSDRGRKQAHGYTGLLLSMQRHLIELVKQELPIKDKRFSLDMVYTSSTTNLKFKPEDNPLDVTCRRLQEMLSDGKTWLPPFRNLLLDRGWTPLSDSEWRGGMVKEVLNLPKAENQPEAFPRHHSDKNKPQRSIWHAPRSKKGGKTRCGNHLYEAAFNARTKDESCQKMRYQYKSTLDWYHDMKVEGRDASHVNVDSADRILDKLIHRKK